jgi:hypothetical protein
MIAIRETSDQIHHCDFCGRVFTGRSAAFVEDGKTIHLIICRRCATFAGCDPQFYYKGLDTEIRKTKDAIVDAKDQIRSAKIYINLLEDLKNQPLEFKGQYTHHPVC